MYIKGFHSTLRRNVIKKPATTVQIIQITDTKQIIQNNLLYTSESFNYSIFIVLVPNHF